MAKRTSRSRSPEDKSAPKTSAAGAKPAADEEAPGTGAKSAAAEPKEEEIRMRAYHRYLERGGKEGQASEDWLYAERELKNR